MWRNLFWKASVRSVFPDLLTKSYAFLRKMVSGKRCVMTKLVMDYIRGEDGATAIEYGLIASAIAVAIIVTVFLIGDWGVDTFEYIRSYLSA